MEPENYSQPTNTAFAVRRKKKTANYNQGRKQYKIKILSLHEVVERVRERERGEQRQPQVNNAIKIFGMTLCDCMNEYEKLIVQPSPSLHKSIYLYSSLNVY